MQVVLVMFRADGERRSFSVAHDVTILGRREDCHLRIPLGDVSRKHCRLVKENDALRIEDLGSSNGTYHNGQRIQEATVSAGDTIQVGPVVFVVQIDGVPADEDLQPAAPEAATTTAAPEEPGEPEIVEAGNSNTQTADKNGNSDKDDTPLPLTEEGPLPFDLGDSQQDVEIPADLMENIEPKQNQGQQ